MGTDLESAPPGLSTKFFVRDLKIFCRPLCSYISNFFSHAAWTLFYMFASLTSTLPWTSCIANKTAHTPVDWLRGFCEKTALVSRKTVFLHSPVAVHPSVCTCFRSVLQLLPFCIHSYIISLRLFDIFEKNMVFIFL